DRAEERALFELVREARVGGRRGEGRPTRRAEARERDEADRRARRARASARIAGGGRWRDARRPRLQAIVGGSDSNLRRARGRDDRQGKTVDARGRGSIAAAADRLGAPSQADRRGEPAAGGWGVER